MLERQFLASQPFLDQSAAERRTKCSACRGALACFLVLLLTTLPCREGGEAEAVYLGNEKQSVCTPCSLQQGVDAQHITFRLRLKASAPCARRKAALEQLGVSPRVARRQHRLQHVAIALQEARAQRSMAIGNGGQRFLRDTLQVMRQLCACSQHVIITGGNQCKPSHSGLSPSLNSALAWLLVPHGARGDPGMASAQQPARANPPQALNYMGAAMRSRPGTVGGDRR